MSKRDKVIELTSEIDRFLIQLDAEHGRVAKFRQEHDPHLFDPEDDFGYAEAVLDWREHGKDPRSIFSTPDPFLILYRKELSEEFGLKILTYEEAEEHKAKLASEVDFHNQITTGDPEVSPEYNIDIKKHTKAMETIEQWARALKKHPSGLLN